MLRDSSFVLELTKVTKAVELQARGYRLLHWLEGAFDAGFILPEAAHRYASMPEAAQGWIEQHYENLPKSARPERDDLRAFCEFFATYLTNTFDLDTNPGKRLFSPDAHCFCPMCSWMVRVPHLRPKKLSPSDKKAAANLKRKFLRSLAVDLGTAVSDAQIESLLLEPSLREPIGLCTYACDLLDRVNGISGGPASLALWRSFAWTAEGSPVKNFVLSAADIIAAQALLGERLTAITRTA